MNRFLFLRNLVLDSYGSFSKGMDIGTTTPNASSGPDIAARGEGWPKPQMSGISIYVIPKPATDLTVFYSLPFKFTTMIKANCDKILN